MIRHNAILFAFFCMNNKNYNPAVNNRGEVDTQNLSPMRAPKGYNFIIHTKQANRNLIFTFPFQRWNKLFDIDI